MYIVHNKDGITGDSICLIFHFFKTQTCLAREKKGKWRYCMSWRHRLSVLSILSLLDDSIVNSPSTLCITTCTLLSFPYRMESWVLRWYRNMFVGLSEDAVCRLPTWKSYPQFSLVCLHHKLHYTPWQSSTPATSLSMNRHSYLACPLHTTTKLMITFAVLHASG